MKNCTHLHCIHYFKDTSLASAASNPLDILPRQNGVGNLTFSLLALNLYISFPLTSKYYYHDCKLFLWCTKASINTKSISFN